MGAIRLLMECRGGMDSAGGRPSFSSASSRQTKAGTRPRSCGRVIPRTSNAIEARRSLHPLPCIFDPWQPFVLCQTPGSHVAGLATGVPPQEPLHNQGDSPSVDVALLAVGGGKPSG